MRTVHPPLLRQLGIIGYDALEPIVLAALATESPLLLIGPHGTAKSLLLCKLCEALGIAWRHYNASLLNFDDLVGYPLPDAEGKLRFVETPASIWQAEAVFLDEISRCRPDMQNRLFSIIHERRVQGLPIPNLKFRWAAMNPPAREDAVSSDSANYLGSEPLDAALADRFNFIIEVPEWQRFSEADRDAVVQSLPSSVDDAVSQLLRERVARVAKEIAVVEAALGGAIVDYVRTVAPLLAQLGHPASGRRAGMLYRNVIATHAARLVASPAAAAIDSAWIALEQSIPQRAEGATIDRAKLMLAHTEAWRAVSLDRADPRRLLVGMACPIERAIRACGIELLSSIELSAHVADALASVGLGGRNALATFVIGLPAAARLNAAIAEQVAELHAATVVAQSVDETVPRSNPKFDVWNTIVSNLASHPSLAATSASAGALTNLLLSSFKSGALAKGTEVRPLIDSWAAIDALCSPHKEALRAAA